MQSLARGAESGNGAQPDAIQYLSTLPTIQALMSRVLRAVLGAALAAIPFILVRLSVDRAAPAPANEPAVGKRDVYGDLVAGEDAAANARFAGERRYRER